jgi:hypothetical protein
MTALRNVASLAPTRQAFSLFEEFKAFAFKGNVIDLAVAVIIGAAFGKIVESLVKHIIMPLVGVILPGDQGYFGWKWVINHILRLSSISSRRSSSPVNGCKVVPRLTVGMSRTLCGPCPLVNGTDGSGATTVTSSPSGRRTSPGSTTTPFFT